MSEGEYIGTSRYNCPKGFYVDSAAILRCCKCGWEYRNTVNGLHSPCWDALDWQHLMEKSLAHEKISKDYGITTLQ